MKIFGKISFGLGLFLIVISFIPFYNIFAFSPAIMGVLMGGIDIWQKNVITTDETPLWGTLGLILNALVLCIVMYSVLSKFH